MYVAIVPITIEDTIIKMLVILIKLLPLNE